MRYDEEAASYIINITDSQQIRVQIWHDKIKNPKIQIWRWVKWVQDQSFHPTGKEGLCIPLDRFRDEILPILIRLCEENKK